MRTRAERAVDRLYAAIAQATLENAVELVGAVREGIQSQAPAGQAFPALHPFTIAQKGSSKALINHGDLIAAIAYVLSEDKLSARVGVKRMAKPAHGDDKGGEDLVNIAKVLTYGAVIPVSDKMRGYLAASGLHLKASTTHIIIPPRPFLEPVFRQLLPKMQGRYRNAVRGAFGHG